MKVHHDRLSCLPREVQAATQVAGSVVRSAANVDGERAVAHGPVATRRGLPSDHRHRRRRCHRETQAEAVMHFSLPAEPSSAVDRQVPPVIRSGYRD